MWCPFGINVRPNISHDRSNLDMACHLSDHAKKIIILSATVHIIDHHTVKCPAILSCARVGNISNTWVIWECSMLPIMSLRLSCWWKCCDYGVATQQSAAQLCLFHHRLKRAYDPCFGGIFSVVDVWYVATNTLRFACEVSQGLVECSSLREC